MRHILEVQLNQIDRQAVLSLTVIVALLEMNKIKSTSVFYWGGQNN